MPTLQMPMLALVIWSFCALGATAVMWRMLFDALDDFWDCIKFWLKPDWWSMLKGQWLEDTWAELRLALWLFGSAVFSVALLWGMNKMVL